MTWQSPIAPGLSWYQATVGERAGLPRPRRAEAGRCRDHRRRFIPACRRRVTLRKRVSVALIEAHRFWRWRFGRNGGQFGTGQRSFPDEMEQEIALRAIEAAVRHRPKMPKTTCVTSPAAAASTWSISRAAYVAHKAGYEDDYRRSVDAMNNRYGYPHISYMERGEARKRVGSTHYFGGTRDNRHRPYTPAEAARRACKSGKGCRRSDLRDDAGEIDPAGGRKSQSSKRPSARLLRRGC